MPLPHARFPYAGGPAKDHVVEVPCPTTVNDTLLHFAHEDLPFGGVGDSGIGAYHGERSFLTFSNEMGVFHQAKLTPARLLWPPYGRTFERLVALLKRL